MNPWEVLGVEPTATEDELRTAYLNKVKEYPPERAPEQFEQVRDAYETLRDPRRRARDLLAAADPDAPLASLVERLAPERRFLGPKPWREVLKGK